MRLFIAITFEDAVLDELEELMAQCRTLGRGGWTRRDNLHLTLEFLGERKDSAAARAAMDAVTAGPVDLTLSGLGFFRREGGDILWLGVDRSPALLDLQKQLHQQLKARGLKLENRPYRPHLTLARRAVMKDLPPSPTLTQHVAAISLMESRRVDGVLTYTELYRKELAG